MTIVLTLTAGDVKTVETVDGEHKQYALWGDPTNTSLLRFDSAEELGIEPGQEFTITIEPVEPE